MHNMCIEVYNSSATRKIKKNHFSSTHSNAGSKKELEAEQGTKNLKTDAIFFELGYEKFRERKIFFKRLQK